MSVLYFYFLHLFFVDRVRYTHDTGTCMKISSLLPTCWFCIRGCVIRVDSKHPYLLSQLTGPEISCLVHLLPASTNLPPSSLPSPTLALLLPPPPLLPFLPFLPVSEHKCSSCFCFPSS